MSKTKTLTIYPYHLRIDHDPNLLFQPDIHDIMQQHIERLLETDIANRRWVYHSNATGEHVQLLVIEERKGYYLFGFGRLSTHEGPAKGNMRGGFTPFNLGPDEGFSNLCAALYDPQTGAFIAEQAKNSLSAETMLNCIQDVHPSLYENPLYLESVLQKNILDKLRDGMIVSRFDFKFSPANISQDDYNENIALRTAAQFASKDQQKGTVQIVLGSQGSDRNKGLGNMGDMLLKGACKILRRYGEFAPISKCEVKVKEDESLPLQTLDLLRAREKCNVEVKIGDTKIVGYEQRFKTIEAAYKKWKNQYFPKILL